MFRYLRFMVLIPSTSHCAQLRALVGQDTREGNARVIVDGQMHRVPADAFVSIECAVPVDAMADALDAPEPHGVCMCSNLPEPGVRSGAPARAAVGLPSALLS